MKKGGPPTPRNFSPIRTIKIDVIPKIHPRVCMRISRDSAQDVQPKLPCRRHRFHSFITYCLSFCIGRQSKAREPAAMVFVFTRVDAGLAISVLSVVGHGSFDGFLHMRFVTVGVYLILMESEDDARDLDRVGVVFWELRLWGKLIGHKQRCTRNRLCSYRVLTSS